MSQRQPLRGPLAGLRIVEFAGIGPGPFAAMLLGDMGADVVRVDRPGTTRGGPRELTSRSRRSIILDLHSQGDRQTACELLKRADALIEGFRPGVMERMGLGPQDVLTLNPRLVYGRMTGWGQSGPLTQAAGHDINYIAITGVLAAIGPRIGKPAVPLNLIGDFAGGAAYLVMGMLAAILEARSSGQGQVVDAAMSDGALSLSTFVHMMRAKGQWNDERGANLLDGGAPFYNVYECADGKLIALGALEPQFFSEFCAAVGLQGDEFAAQYDRTNWPAIEKRLSAVFRTKTRQQWCDLLEGSDACFAPVLDWAEAPMHAHHRARETFVTVAGVPQPAPAPRFSRTPSVVQCPAPVPGIDRDSILQDWGIS